MPMIREFAPAKLNLYLHITARRPDGYHDLDSLVGFASVGDEIALCADKGFRFEVTGPQASGLLDKSDEDNLAVKAAQSLAELVGRELDVHMVLVKNLPVASGIGGGSADAAAALRALARHWDMNPHDPKVMQAALRHGQDVPVCVRIENTYMTATGVLPAAPLPRADVVLVNPGQPLATPAVYKRFREGGYGFSDLARLENNPETLAEMIEALKARTNDLYAPAAALMPEVGEVVDVLSATKECLLARMSGSGATCFGIYPDAVAAKSASAQIRAQRPRWWVEAGTINENA